MAPASFFRSAKGCQPTGVTLEGHRRHVPQHSVPIGQVTAGELLFDPGLSLGKPIQRFIEIIGFGSLDAQTKSMKIPVDAKAHNEKVLQLNERIADFEKRRQTIRKKIDAFNEPKIASTDTD